jgi:RimJ/RimL family protein N-acetyltransferase
MEVRVMLSGESIRLRPVREDDLAELYARHVELADRGAHFPLGVLSEPAFRRAFHGDGFWTPDEGMLVVTDERGTIVGHVEFYRTVKYLDEAELSYQIYGDGNRGKGYATEAVALMTRYLFEHTKVNRIRLLIHPENAASRRVAEKARFSFESIAEGIWHHRGRNEDLAVYVALRDRFLASG